ncbi:MAG TPA: lytic transglycosylase domain-containing protein [Solirubrobacterales bacterium]|nr:lytic transglycosylase domain-containing protein [Solirubrobacterales bacterium]
MSAAVEGVGPSTAGIAAASEAAARVAELRGMIQAVETGTAGNSSSFSDALAEATAVSGGDTTIGEASAVTSPSPTTSALATTAATTATETGETAGSGAVPYQSLIEEACAKYGVEPALLAGLIEQESHFDPSVGSGAGAQGLTELMPETAAGLGVTDPHDPTQSIEAGARLLSEKLSEFGGNKELALAAYNAGSGAVQQYNGIPPYPETQEYVQKVLGYASGYASAFGGVA